MKDLTPISPQFQAVVMSRQALLFEEFIGRELAAGRFSLDLQPDGAPILVHGHCHQKAFGAVSPILDVLRLIPGARPELIESSCCGMAGSFGYEASHHDVSMQMAELSLLPTIRRHPDAIVVADGTSCRHQIADGSQRSAIHIARLLESLLVNDAGNRSVNGTGNAKAPVVQNSLTPQDAAR